MAYCFKIQGLHSPAATTTKQPPHTVFFTQGNWKGFCLFIYSGTCTRGAGDLACIVHKTAKYQIHHQNNKHIYTSINCTFYSPHHLYICGPLAFSKACHYSHSYVFYPRYLSYFVSYGYFFTQFTDLIECVMTKSLYIHEKYQSVQAYSLPDCNWE